MEQLIDRSIGHGRAISSPFPLQRTNFYGVLYRRMRRTYRRQSDYGERKENAIAPERRLAAEADLETWWSSSIKPSTARTSKFCLRNKFIRKYCIVLTEQNILQNSFTYNWFCFCRRRPIIIDLQSSKDNYPSLRFGIIIIVQVRRWRNFGVYRTQHD